MKKHFKLSISAIFLLALVVSCNRNDDTPAIPVSSVSLSPTSATLVAGDTLTLIATVQPADAANQAVSWSSSSTEVATVLDGLVTTITEGEVTITVTTEDGNRTATATITVTPAPIPVESVTLNKNLVTLVVDETLTFMATILPESATNQTITWSSSNDGVATVVDGVVTAVSQGIATIMVTTEDGDKTATSSIAIVSSRSNCSPDASGLGDGLGTVSFASTRTWAIGDQTWSDAVTATGCQKAMFVGGVQDWANPENNSWLADCRENPEFPGDLFSWCAVVKFAAELCPYPWRVPTMQDFMNLDIALGGDGTNRGSTLAFVTENYIERWGGAFGGTCSMIGALQNQSQWGQYWSQSLSPIGTGNANFLDFRTNGLVSPQGLGNQRNGMVVRCVR